MSRRKLQFANEASLFQGARAQFGGEGIDIGDDDDDSGSDFSDVSTHSSDMDSVDSGGDISDLTGDSSGGSSGDDDEDDERMMGAASRAKRSTKKRKGAAAVGMVDADMSSSDDDDSDDDDSDDDSSEDDVMADKRRKLLEWAVEEEARKRARHRRKHRVLVLSSTGVGARFRHLMNDISSLLPHAKRDSKVDVKKNLHELNELADVNSCEKCLFFQMKSKRDMFMWAARCPTGPSVLFQVHNIHTMSELKLTGNCLAGSRPVLLFDDAFSDPAVPHLGMIKELFEEIWATPAGHPKAKPFIDHVICFFWHDDHIWFRNYQIIENVDGTKKGSKSSAATTQMAEIGPRFVLEPVRIFSQAFGGPTVWKNDDYVTPSKIRAAERRLSAGAYANRAAAQERAQVRNSSLGQGLRLPSDEFAETFRR